MHGVNSVLCLWASGTWTALWSNRNCIWLAIVDRQTKIRLVQCSLGAAIGPYAVLSAFIVVGRWFDDRIEIILDYVGTGFGLVTGAIFIVLLPVALWVRLLPLVTYLPVVAYLSILYGLYFIGFVYNEWL